MGQFINGQWLANGVGNTTDTGQFERKPVSFRSAVEAGHEAAYPAEANRYHLYVSHACPWAHRTLIFRKLKKLEDIIGVSVVNPIMGSKGWDFQTDYPNTTADQCHHLDLLGELYLKADPYFTGRVTVPVLWDTVTETIVNNESSEIIRFFNTAFNQLTGNTIDYYPQEHQAEIDELNEKIYHTVNNGVYKAGFARTQNAYQTAVTALFDTLDELEKRLNNRSYLLGELITEADWRLFVTLIRFDVVYVGHFKCNLRRISDYPNLSRYLKRLYWQPGIKETVHLNHIKDHYYMSHPSLNPHRIVPVGPDLDFLRP